jgi:hypothetical protein
LSPTRQLITFSFGTRGGVDGLDFKVDDDAQQVVFNLAVSSRYDPRLVFIGSTGVNPSGSTFALPAHPPAREPKHREGGDDKPRKGRSKKPASE